MKKLLMIGAMFTLYSAIAFSQVIDMHMHSYTEKDFWVGKARNGLESSKSAGNILHKRFRK